MTKAKTGKANQQFKIQEKQLIEDGYYVLWNHLGGKHLDVAGGSKAKGANVQLYSPNYSAAQKWYVKHVGNNSYKLQNVGSNLYLGTGKNGNVQQNSWGNISWKITINDGGGFVLRHLGDKVLDVAGGQNRNGANVQVYKDNGTMAQRWTLARVNKY